MSLESGPGEGFEVIHNIRGALSGLGIAVKLLQSGYRFDDERAADIIAEMAKSVAFLDGTMQGMYEKILANESGVSRGQQSLIGSFRTGSPYGDLESGIHGRER